jgi:hypothetical protein
VTADSIRAILDTTAILAFTAGSEDLGEILQEITDEDDARFALPDLCLIEAFAGAKADRSPLLDVLVGHPRCERLPLGREWRDIGAAAKELGGAGRAVAMLAAVDHGAYLLTAEPEAFGGDESVLVISV